MCVIAIKPTGLKLQEKEVLQRCFTANKDGAGYMFVKNNEVIIKKGFMTFELFYKSLLRDYRNNKLQKQNLVMHFRIGTSGQSKTGCTHPFPITDNMKQLEQLRFKTNIGICHNGIVSGFNSYVARFSDTQLYISTVLTPIIRLNLQAYKFKDVQNLILKTTTSKWTILDKNDECYTIGNFVEDKGYMYSNETFKPVTYKAPTYLNTYAATPKRYDEEETLDSASSWYDKAFKNQKSLEDKKSTTVIIDEDKYQALEIGNVVCGGNATIKYYEKMMEYFEVLNSDKYYIDKDYNLYLIYTSKTEGEIVTKIATDVAVYEDETIGRRIGWNE